MRSSSSPPAETHADRTHVLEGFRAVSDGTRLLVRDWHPRGSRRAALLVVHGVGEHGGRYARFGRRLAEAGIAVRVPDQRGHGRSEGPRGHVADWSRYLTDAGELASGLARDAPGVPLFAFGHSMGSLIVLDLAIRSAEADPGADPVAVAGWIVSGVGIRPAGVATPMKVALARLLSRILPRLTLGLGIAPEALSRDPAVQRVYRDDSLVLGRATVRWGAEALDAIVRVERGAHRIRDPLLILHGEEDPLSDPEGARWLAGEVGDAELHIYPHVRHEPHNDADGCDPVGDLLAWISARIAEVRRV